MLGEPARNCTSYDARGLRGLTLVELTISMLIMAAIAGLGGRLFLTALRTSRELDELAEARQSATLIIDQLRRDAANLIPTRIRGMESYSEGIDLTKGARIYQLLVRLPQGYSTELAPADAQAVIMRYTVSQNPDQSLSLSYSKQFIGVSGAIGEPVSGALAHKAGFFTMQPVYQSNKGGGASSGEAEIPSGIQAYVQFNLPMNETYAVSQFLPAPAQGPGDK